MKAYLLVHHYGDDPSLMLDVVEVVSEYVLEAHGFGPSVGSARELLLTFSNFDATTGGLDAHVKTSYGPGSYRIAEVELSDRDLLAAFDAPKVSVVGGES